MSYTFENLKKLVGQTTQMSPSAYANWLNGTITKVEFGAISVEFTIRPEMSNPIGNLHGGVTAGILDEVIGMTLVTLDLQSFFSTVNLTIDYLSPILIGETVTAETFVVRQGKKIIHVEAKVLKLNGKIAAKATSNLIDSGIVVVL